MALELQNVNYIYGEGTADYVAALTEINLSIPENQFVALIGHTGSGKSTLIQHLNGLVKPTSGTILYNGIDIHSKEYDLKKHRCHVGLVFQYPEHQLFEMDVISDVAYGPRNQGLSKKEARAKAKEALELVGLDEKYYEKSPFELSGGQKRRVAIAGVLAMEPDILILDEPTAGLDPKGRDKILNLVKKIQKERKITVILVSHSMEDVAKYADRIIVMNQGKMMFDDTPEAVFEHWKELEKIGLAAPQITYLMRRMKQEGYAVDEKAITVEQALKGLLKNA